MQTNGKRARLQSAWSDGRPFFRPPGDLTTEREVDAIENGPNASLREALADLQRRKADLIASAEAWRNDRVRNIENEFDGAIKAALDQYNEDVRRLRHRLIDEVQRNRRRYVDTNGLPSPPVPSKMRSAAAIDPGRSEASEPPSDELAGGGDDGLYVGDRSAQADDGVRCGRRDDGRSAAVDAFPGTGAETRPR